jgi:GWxTD domain-containing protein
MGLFFLYRSFLLHDNSNHVEKWLIKNQSVYSQFFLGELYRQKSFFHQADSLYQNLIDSNYPGLKIPAKLSQAKSRLSNGSPLEAEMIYWQSIRSIKDSLDARFIFEDLKYICVNEELKEYAQLKTVENYKKYFKKFWVKRDPLPASPDNLRFMEHYRRLVFAEKEFRFDGYRTWNANPNLQGFLEYPNAFYLNRDLNDKGLVYVRHGHPDDKATTLGESVAYNESWLYNERDGLPKLIFHFEIDEDGLAGDWRLTPMLKDEAAVNSVVMWDESYARYLRDNANMRNRIANEIAIENKNQVRIAMATDRHSWDKAIENLPVYFSMANFKGKNNHDLSELYVEFPIEKTLADTSSSNTVNMGIALHDKFWNEIGKSDDYFQIDLNGPQIVDNQFIQTFQFELIPLTYRFSLHIDVLESPLLGGFKFNVTLPNYLSDRLLSSDPILAFEMAAKDPAQPVSKSNMDFKPNPSKRFRKGSPLYVYFEIYNLTKNTSGQTNYTVNYLVKNADGGGGFLGLFGGKKSETISIETE